MASLSSLCMESGRSRDVVQHLMRLVYHVWRYPRLPQPGAQEIAGLRAVFHRGAKLRRAQVASQYVMSPPIRNKEHQRQLKASLAGGILEVQHVSPKLQPLSCLRRHASASHSDTLSLEPEILNI